MSGSRLALLTLVLLSWGGAAVGGQLLPMLGPTASAWLVAPWAFCATLLLPGYLLDRAAGTSALADTHPFEVLGRSFAISVGLVAASGLVASLLGASVAKLSVFLLAASSVLSLTNASSRRADQDHDEVRRSRRWSRASTVALIVLVVALVAMAAGGENFARDRTWYLAYITRMPLSDSIGWREPFFGETRWPQRFLANGWILSMSVWTSLGGLSAPFVFERIAPVLLIPVMVSATLALARSVFGRGARATAGVLTTTAVLFATHFPFFSPERYPFFGRLVEDKFLALLVLAPVAMAAMIDYLGSRRPSNKSLLTSLALMLYAVGLSHPLVYLIAAVTLATLVLLRIAARTPMRTKRVVAAAVLVFLVGTVPGWIGYRAASKMFGSRDPMAVYRTDPTHPVVRSHIRMERLMEIDVGGPVVDPGLLAEPLLLVGLACLVLAAWRWRTPWGAFLLAGSLPFLALAFTPFVSPLFGRFVLPWMSYRALWGIPFGLLLVPLLVEVPALVVPAGVRRIGSVTALGVLVGLAAWHGVPWERLAPSHWWQAHTATDLDPPTRELLAAVAELPDWAVIATGTGLSELIPGYTGRHVVAISDRGTMVFTGSRGAGEKRLRSLAAIIGLKGGSLKLRNQLAARYNVTHVVYEGGECDRKTERIFRNERYTLCAERSHDTRVSRLERTTAQATAAPAGKLYASLGDGITCEPTPAKVDRERGTTWRREWRWSARPIVVDCEADFEKSVKARTIRITLAIPHAHESLVYRVRVKTHDGFLLKRQGALDFRGNPRGEIPLKGRWIKRIKLRLVPSFLPYLHIRRLEIRGG